MLKQFQIITTIWLALCSCTMSASQNISLKAKSFKRAKKALALIDKGNRNLIDAKHQDRSSWYLEARDLLHPGDDKIVLAQALIGLGNAGYTDSFYREAYMWYLDAWTLLHGTKNRIFKIKTLIGLAHAGYTDSHHSLPCFWLYEALDLADNHYPYLKTRILLELGQ